ncbi:hypothetical protein JCM8547_004639 [Rhodosporidiobolus lusitaniae]
MFRVNAGPRDLRDHDTQVSKGRHSYDLHLEKADGFVYPLRDPSKFATPNGASLRPDGPMFQEIVRNFDVPNAVVWELDEGLPLPSELILYHEHSDHYSIQTRVPMPLPELNERITRFLVDNCHMYTREECREFPF